MGCLHISPLCRRLAPAALILVTLLDTSRAQSILGIRVGDDREKFQAIRSPPTVVDHPGSFTVSAWDLSNGNTLSATTSKSGTIVYVELDWGGRESGAQSDFPGFTFGRTTLADIRQKFGSNGMGFKNRPSSTKAEGGIALLNSYEVGSVIVTFVTKIQNIDFPVIQTNPSALSKTATLDALILSESDYARINWGEAAYDTSYKPIQWK
jgi:hypothetical protein